MSVQERFDVSHRKSDVGCWNWIGSLVRGYGSLMDNYKRKYAHRVSYELHVGAIPEGKYVCHRCDNPLCVNPAHLFLGTAKDNISDMIRKGRRRPDYFGENSRKAKITNVQASQIRSDPRTYRAIGADFGLSSSAVSNIKNGITWAR